MKKQELNLSNDETQLDPTNQISSTKAQTLSYNNAEQGEEPNIEKTQKERYKKMAMAGVGVVAGVVGSLGLTAFMPAPSVSASQGAGGTSTGGATTPLVSEPAESMSEIQVSQSPTDNMSFNEAFAAARADVGGHGVFEWRGNVYGTYYAEEWDKFPQSYKDEFSAHNWREVDGINSVSPQQNLQAENVDHFGSHEIHVDDEGQEYIVLTDAITGEEVRISPEDLQYAVLDCEGDVVAVMTEESYLALEASDTNLTQIDANGNIDDVALLDGSDSAVELALIDEDDDDVVILNSEVAEVDIDNPIAIDLDPEEAYNISMLDEVQGDEMSDFLASNDLPDYMNDASVDDFIV